jgi:hypothetical protein
MHGNRHQQVTFTVMCVSLLNPSQNPNPRNQAIQVGLSLTPSSLTYVGRCRTCHHDHDIETVPKQVTMEIIV